MLHVDDHVGTQALERMARPWEELAASVDAPPWLRPGWFLAWMDAFAQGTPHLLVARRSGEAGATAIAPLLERHGTLHAAANWHTPSYAVVAGDPTARAALLVAMLGTRRPFELRFLDTDSPELQALRASGARLLERPLERSPFVALDRPFAELEARLGRSLLAEIRRRTRRLEETGDVELDVFDGTDGRRVDALLDDGLRIEGSGWKRAQGTAILSDPAVERFYRSLAAWAADAGWLRLAFLRVGGRAVAFQLLLQHGGAIAQLKGGYDPAFRACAPGILLVHALLRWATDRSLRTYEFLGDDAPFKATFATGVRERVAVAAFPSTLHGLTRYGVETVCRPAARRAKALRRR